MGKLWLAPLLLVLFCITAKAQESNCGDGVDNDGDGFIDCFDTDCAGNNLCKDFYIGQNKLCQVPTTDLAKFEMKLKAKSPDRTTRTYGRMAIGDLDNDGIPEVVTVHADDKKLYILRGSDLTVKYSANTTGTPDWYDHAIADVKTPKGCASIFIAEQIGSNYFVTSYDCKGVKLWSTQAYGEPYDFGVADFDGDGKAEIYYHNEILDAVTGLRLVKGSGDWTTIDAGPVAVDMLSPSGAGNLKCATCPVTGLELVLGGLIYSVNFGARTLDAGTLTLQQNMRNAPTNADYYPKKSTFGYITSQTSIADYNQDGYLDVVTSGATSSTTGATTAFFWDVKNGKYKTYVPSNNWAHGTGRLNIADIDGDGKLNTTFVSGSVLWALKDDFTLLWKSNISEVTSGFTGATVFDFNNDGASEIVYRDEGSLYIIDGKTGSTSSVANPIPCRSRTSNEYPVVADIDGDGATEICVACATNDSDAVGSSNTAGGQIRSYGSNLEPWVPSRKVWNQHGYFNVNINDDLSIPKIQQFHHLVFSTGSACNPTGNTRPLNTFLNQSPFLDSKGCPTHAAPDLVFDPASTFTVNAPTCPDQDFTVSFTIKNSGNLGLSGSLPITFYSGDPTKATSLKLNTEFISLNNLKIGDTFSVNNLIVHGTGSIFTLYIALNNNGNNTPIALPWPNAPFLECNYLNNVASYTVTPKPFTIETELISDNIKCAAGASAANGAVKAYRLINGVKTTLNYTFYWFNGATAGDTATAVYKGSVYSGLNQGTYSVIAYPKGISCNSASKSITVGVQARTLTLALVEDKPYTSCKSPDGAMHVQVNSGDPVGNFIYEWYSSSSVFTGSILSKNSTLTNIDAGSYTVYVIEKTTQCSEIKGGNITDKTPKFVVSPTATDAKCNPPNSGSISANVAGNTANYTFNWYNGPSVKPTTDFVGTPYTNLSIGKYTVIAIEKVSGCASPADTISVNSKTIQAVVATVNAQQTSCSSVSNGAASASINNITAGYTWKWFKGNNTLPTNQVGTNPTITNLAAGTYTVQATDVSGCSASNVVTVNDVLTIPVIATPTINSHQTNCALPNGSVTVSASTAIGPFQYYWFNGNVGTPDTTAANFKGATYASLKAGFYTVVAVDKITRCASARSLVQIKDNTIIPSISTTPVAQTSCDLSSPNGKLSANVGGATIGYTFTWYAGSGTGGAVKGSTAAFTLLAAGTYTVLVVDNTTGCSNTAQATVVTTLVNPTVSASIVSHQTVCNSPNGSVSADVGGVTAGYTFYWFNGNVATPNILAPDFTGAVYSGRTAGSYTVVAVDNTTKCQSAKATVQVLDNSVPPTISTTPIAQTSCDLSSPNGKLSANVGGATIGYTFTWYAGSGTGGAVKGSTAALTLLAAGTYTVLVVDNTTGCSNTAQATVVTTLVNPTVSASIVSHQTVCNSPNGSVSADVGGVTAGYTFYWFNGNVATPNILAPDFTGAVYSGRTAGSYTVVAVDNTTKCQSAKATVQVLDNSVPPTISTTPVAQTSCDLSSPNGKLSANVGGATIGYTFTWYAGSGTGGAVKGSTAALTLLAAGTYTVLVVDNTTGCSNTAQATVVTTLVNPTVSASIVSHQTVCNSPNGSVSADVGGVTAGYTFYWFNGNVATPNILAPDFTGAVYSGRTAGSYTVVAVDNTTKCQSAKATVQVLDNSVPPTISTTPVAQTSCDLSSPNGKLSANVGGATIGYTFTWYAGSGTGGAVKGSTAALTLLAAGTYTVLVVDNTTGCSNTAQATVVTTLVNPTVSASIVSHQTVCNSPNGSVSADVGGVTAGYTFYWFNGNVATPNILAPDFTGAVYSGRTAGSYTVVAVDNTTKCQSAKATVQVLDNSVPPTISTTPIAQTSCDLSSPNGKLSANVGGATIGYTFTWYAGSGTGGAVKGSTAALTLLAAGTYTVLVVDNTTGCSNTAQATVVTTLVNPTVSASIVSHQTVCNSPNGSVSADVGGVTAGYTFYWFNGNVATPNILAPDFTGAVYSGRTAGSYTVVAVDNTTKCQSAKATVQVLDNSVPPTISTTPVAQTSCDLSSPNGKLSANVGGATIGYTFTWYAGSGTGGAVKGSTAALTLLAAGTYTVLVVDNTTGCSNTAQATVVTTLVNPTVSASIVSHQTVCNSPNGSVSADVGGVTAGYTFYWFNGNVATPNILAPDFTGAVYSGRTAGSYTVVAVDNTTKCQSAKATVQVLDNSVPPTISTTPVAQTSCDLSSPNGKLSANVGGATIGYTFTWYAGSGTGGAVKGSTASLTLLAAGTYTVLVVDNTTGCSNTAQATVVTTLVNPTVSASIVSHQTVCNSPNGSVSADVGGVTAGYTFYWFNGNVATPNILAPDFTGAVYSGRTAGSYTVVAVDNTTKCQSAKATVQVLDNSVPPTISTTPVAQTSCDLSSPNGKLSANVGGATIGYTFTWYAGSGTGGAVKGSTASLTLLAAGTYTVLVVDNTTGCSNTAQATVVTIFTNPVVTPNVDAQLTFCTSPNGQVSANVGGVTAGFTFYWFNGNISTPDITSPNFTGAVYSNLPIGSYTVVAVDNNTKCQSIKATVNIIDNTVPPSIATLVVNQTSCDPASPNGQASADVGGVTAGYTFTWYAGSGTSGAVKANTAVATALAAGTYTVKAVNNTTGCSNTAQKTIINNQVSPIVIASKDKDQKNCSSGDGQVSASVGGVTAGYTFYWFKGNVNTPNIASPDFVGDIYANLVAGVYTVIAVDNITKCQSSKQIAEVLDNTVPPIVSASPLDNTACDPLKSNGTISANVGGLTMAHIFHIFKGQNTIAANEVVGSPSFSVSNLAIGTYTIQAIDKITGCSATTEVTINNNITLPTISATATDALHCAPPDGSITASISIGSVADYTFSYFNGNALKSPPADYAATTNILTGILQGTYTVTAFNNVLGCDVQNPFTVDVKNDPSLAIKIDTLLSERIIPAICNDGTGQIGVKASSPANALGFTFDWFQGTKNIGLTSKGTGINFPVNSNRLSGVNAGIYSVIAFDKTTQCRDTAIIHLPYSDEAALVSILTKPQTDCLNPNGEVEVQITPSTGTLASFPGVDQTFYQIQIFQNGNLLVNTQGTNTSTIIPGLKAGNYTIIAVERSPLPGCLTQPRDTIIQDKTMHPDLLASTLVKNRNCVGATPTGSIALEVDHVITPASGYTYTWYAGKLTSDPALAPANVMAPGHTIVDVAGGFYTTEVTNTTNNCTSKGTYNILDDPYKITIPSADLTIAEQFDCTPVDGAAQVTDVFVDNVSSGGIAGFTFDWFESDGVTLIPAAGNGAIVGTALSASTYFIKATNTTSNCFSPLIQFAVKDKTNPPAIAAITTINNTNCVGVTANGSITISMNGGVDPVTDFTIEWFEGNGTTVALGTTVGTTAGTNNETAQNLPSGKYTVRVTDNTSLGKGCQSTALYEIIDNPAVIGIDVATLSLTDQADCNPASGNASVVNVLVDGVAAGTAGYTFQWFETDGTTVVLGSGATSSIGVNVFAGNYHVAATNTTTNCISTLTPFEIKDVHVNPAIAAITTINNTNCVGVTANGSITISMNGGVDPVTDFTIEWFEGNGTTVALGTTVGTTAGTNNETAQNLPSGKYTVRVTDNTSLGKGCQSTALYEIIDNPAVIGIDVATLSLTDQADCNPASGNASVVNVLVDGVAAGTAGYTFQWFETDGTTVVLGSGATSSIGVNVFAGNYHVAATNTTTNCISTLTSFEIKDVHVNPAIAAITTINNTNCVGVTANGSITISMNGGVDPVTDFTIEWFEGNGTTVALGTTVGTTAGTNNETAQNLPSGKYTVRVTDNTSLGKGCQSTALYEIIDNPAVIGIDVATLSLTDQADCNPASGNASVVNVLVDGVAAGTAGYTFQWFETDGTTVVLGSGATSSIGVNVFAGNYHVAATNTTTNCISTLTPFEIKDVHVNPAIAAITTINNTNCVGVTANGSITISMNGGVDPVTDFTIEWFEGNGTTVALGTTVGTTAGTNNETAQNLPSGKYTVRVTDNTSLGKGCQSTALYEIIDNPAVIGIDVATLSLTDQADCNPASGNASVVNVLVDGVAAGTAGYTFQWFETDGTTVVLGSGATSSIGVNVFAGNYHVAATNTTTNCISTLTPFEIKDVHVNPAIAAITTINNTNCVGVTANGSITISMNGGVDPVTDFTIEWFEGNGTTVALGTTVGTTAGTNNETAQNLPSGKYTVRVTDNTSLGKGCQSTALYEIIDNPAVIGIDVATLSLTDQADCNPASGNASVVNVLVDGVAAGTAGYTFQWFETDGTTVVLGSGATSSIGVNVFAGNYHVAATNTTTNCISTLTPFEIKDVHVNPAIAAITTINNTNCVGVTANGSITISMNGGVDPVTDFTIEWFEGNGTTVALGTTVGTTAGTNNETAQNLPSGKYTVRVTDNTSLGKGCQSTALYEIIDNPAVIGIDVATLSLTDQADCNPASGNASVVNVLVDGVAAGTAGYTFQWFETDGTTVVLGSGATSSIGVNVFAGNYHVAATNTTTNCISTLTPFEIKDVHVNPAIAAITTINNTNCVGVTANGSITISMNGGVDPVTDFTIEWFEGNGTTVALGTTVGTTAGTNNETAQNLPSGKYTVRVTDNTSLGKGCQSTALYEIIDNPAVIGIDVATLSLTDQADCNPASGNASVVNVLVDGVAAGTAGYTFQWFETDGTTVVLGSGATSSIGVNVFAGNYHVAATNTTTNCISTLTPFEIKDVHVNPAIAAITTINNTNCVGVTANGSITISMNGGVDPVTDFTIEWFEGNGTTVALGTTVGTTAGTNNETAQNLPSGKYTVRVTDNTSLGKGCQSTALYEIIDNPAVIGIDVATLSLTDQADCNPASGNASVVNVLVDGVAAGTAGYTFQWFETDGTTVVLGSGATSSIGVNVFAGNYHVAATNTTTNCISTLTPFEIKDVHVNPAIAAITTINNTNCVGVTANGSITISMNGGVDPVTDFTIEWFEGNGTTVALGTTVGTTAGTNNETAQNLPSGKYTVRVTDNTSLGKGCQSTALYEIIDNPAVIGIDVATLSLTDQADCNPASGNASVVNVLVDGVAAGTAGYTFQWFETDGTTVVLGSGATSSIGVNVFAGNYHVAATNTTTNCISTLTPFEIKDVHVNPAIVVVQDMANYACNTNYTGQLSASVSEATTSGVTAGYLFEWFKGINNTALADFISAGPSINGLQDGDYTVRVSDTSSPNNNCTTQTTIHVNKEVLTETIKLAIVSQTVCSPIQDGSVSITGVQETLMGTTTSFDMNNPADVSKFSFKWFDASLNIIPSETTEKLLTVAAGTYYAEVTNVLLGCASTYTMAVVGDLTKHPVVELNEFANPAICILPEVSGYLIVVPDRTQNLNDYNYEWYEGSTAGAPSVIINATNELDNVVYTAADTYTVRVINPITHCFSDLTYIFKTDIIEIQTLASSTPVTSCVTNNASLYATTVQGNGSLYTYDWFIGPLVKPSPDVIDPNNIPEGVYTAIAKHPTLATCNVLPDTALVKKSLTYPQVSIHPIAPLTYCDPSKANGAASADVKGSIIGYTFAWFEGAITTTPYATGSEVNSLSNETYFVRATDVVSGCPGTNSITIANDPLVIKPPIATVIYDRTDCESANGELAASVNYVINGYTMQWYNGSSVKSTPDALGDIYENLDEGTYTLTLKDGVSGCASLPISASIKKILVLPDFTIYTTATDCIQENGVEANGTAELIPANGSDIQTVYWYVDGAIFNGPNVYGLTAGKHSVTATSSLHCDNSKDFEVKTEITMFNAVSPNNDGDNEIFEIGCITDFPNNTVRIYNRAGTLVYEGKGYNNSEIVFDGNSNKGVSVLGHDLPDGTYFYIVDKGDGSKAKSGYLELLR